MDVTIEPGTMSSSAPSRARDRSTAGGGTVDDPAAPEVSLDQAEIDRELRLVDAAISMVWRRVASRVTLASLQLGHAVLDAATARATLYGLEVRVVPAADHGPIAIIVERGEG